MADSSTIELIIPVFERGDLTLQFPFPESARAGAVLLLVLQHHGSINVPLADLTQPLLNLRNFGHPAVDLRQPFPQSADDALNRYLDQHRQVFSRIEKAEQHQLHSQSLLQLAQQAAVLLLLLTLTLGWVVLEINEYLLELDGLQSRIFVLSFLMLSLMVFPIFILKNRLGLLERHFINDSRRKALRAFQMDPCISTQDFVKQHNI